MINTLLSLYWATRNPMESLHLFASQLSNTKNKEQPLILVNGLEGQ